jgi:hypothetical protein
VAVTSFIPAIWNASLLTDFREQAVAAGLTNREYEGNAAAGNTVKINSAIAIGVTDYKTAGRITSASAVSSQSQDLLIDQEKSFDFYIDDIDRAQAAGGMDAYTRSAGEGLAEDADKFILSTAVTAANAGNTETSVALTTGDQAFNLLRDLRKSLNKNHVPQGNRVAVVNAEFEALLLDASSRLTAFDTSGSTEGLRNAALGRLLGFDIYVSENLPTVAKQQVLAFYRPAVAYVSQIEKTEGMRATDKFADRLRGLHVYGAKVIRPTAVAQWTAT